MEPQFGILGLRWESNFTIDNGQDSLVVVFPTLRPATLVFHGSAKFRYEQYGVHLGQTDRLTFLGASERKVTGRFLDCRSSSDTHGMCVEAVWAPTSSRRLVIPAGVAHAFDGLEDVTTLNTYSLSLPDASEWLAAKSDWDMGSDVINFPFDVEPTPRLKENCQEPSDDYYRLVAELQRTALRERDSEKQYPTVMSITASDGEKHRLAISERSSGKADDASRESSTIEGVSWRRLPSILSSETSGFVPLVDPLPLYFVDHGEGRPYKHDAYGIHRGQEDRLIFCGSSGRRIRLRLVDCRSDSSTLHRRDFLEFEPSAEWLLTIPPGIAHAFEGLEDIFTVNRPRSFLPSHSPSLYEPGNDVQDWPLDRSTYPTVSPNQMEATAPWYQWAMNIQGEQLATNAGAATPAILSIVDEHGVPKRIAFRKRARG